MNIVCTHNEGPATDNIKGLCPACLAIFKTRVASFKRDFELHRKVYRETPERETEPMSDLNAGAVGEGRNITGQFPPPPGTPGSGVGDGIPGAPWSEGDNLDPPVDLNDIADEGPEILDEDDEDSDLTEFSDDDEEGDDLPDDLTLED